MQERQREYLQVFVSVGKKSRWPVDERRKSFGYGAAGHGTTGVVLTTVLILCHDEPGHMVGRREQSISVKRRALAFWVENRTRKATRLNFLLLEECAVLPRGGYLLNGTSDCFWRELVQS